MTWRDIRPLVDTGAVILISYGLGFASGHVAPFLLFGFFAAILLFFYIDRDYRRGLALLSFCIPFERLGSVDLSGITIRPSQLVALTLCIVAGELIVRKKISFTTLPHVPLLILFFLLAGWSSLNALNSERTMLVTAFTLFTCTTSVMIPLLARTEKDIRLMCIAGFASYLVVVCFGLYQWAGDWIGLPQSLTGLRTLYTKEILGFPRLQSTALEPLYFANYLLIPLSILSSYFLSRTPAIRIKHLVPSLALGIIALLLTVARGGYLAFGISLCVLAILHIRTLIQPRTIITGVLCVIGLSIAFTALNNGEIVAQYFSHVTNLFTGASYNERVHMYDIAKDAFHGNPWLGIGLGGFGPFASIHPYVIPADGWNIVNNEYLELLAENGILGFATMMIIFIMVIVRSLQAIMRAQNTSWLKNTLIGCVAAFIGILAQYNTFSILYIMHVWFLIGIMIALQNLLLKKNV